MRPCPYCYRPASKFRLMCSDCRRKLYGESSNTLVEIIIYIVILGLFLAMLIGWAT